MQWNAGYSESVHTFANTINTHEGGTHEEGFRAALTTVVNKYAKDKKLLKEKDANLTGDDIREGLAAVDLGEGQRAAVRGPDQDQARQHRGEVVRAEDLQRTADATGSRPTRPRRRPSSTRRCRRRRRAWPRARRESWCAARAPPTSAACPASSPTAAPPIRASRNCMWWRVIRPAARPRAAATRCSRRSCRCAARSSTSRRPASTGC